MLVDNWVPEYRSVIELLLTKRVLPFREAHHRRTPAMARPPSINGLLMVALNFRPFVRYNYLAICVKSLNFSNASKLVL